MHADFDLKTVLEAGLQQVPSPSPACRFALVNPSGVSSVAWQSNPAYNRAIARGEERPAMDLAGYTPHVGGYELPCSASGPARAACSCTARVDGAVTSACLRGLAEQRSAAGVVRLKALQTAG